MFEKRRGATGWPFIQGLLFTMVLIALLSTLSGCGSGQTDVGQTNGNNVPVNLNISMPQESAAASTSGSRFWAKLQSWLPSVTNAWAVTYDLSELTVTVTDSDQQLLTTKHEMISLSHNSGESIPIDLEVPVGPDRIFAVSGVDRNTGSPILQGKSTPVTLTAGKAASVEVVLAENTTTGTVTGTVINEVTAAPLSNATVTVAGRGLSTTTDSTGNFTLPGVPQGPQTLTVSLSGFNNATKAVTVVAKASVSAGTIALTQIIIITTGTVTGTVIDVDTRALLSGAKVAVGDLSTTTDSKGNFELRDVPRGEQTLTICRAVSSPMRVEPD